MLLLMLSAGLGCPAHLLSACGKLAKLSCPEKQGTASVLGSFEASLRAVSACLREEHEEADIVEIGYSTEDSIVLEASDL